MVGRLGNRLKEQLAAPAEDGERKRKRDQQSGARGGEEAAKTRRKTLQQATGAAYKRRKPSRHPRHRRGERATHRR